MPEQTQDLSLGEFIQKCYDLFGPKVKIKLTRNSRGYTWENTVRAETEQEAMKITTWINEKLITLTQEWEDGAKTQHVKADQPATE